MRSLHSRWSKGQQRIDQRVLHQKQHLSCRPFLGPLINNISSYLKIEPMENPRLLRKVDERYFQANRGDRVYCQSWTTARGHSVWRKPILSSSVSQGHRRPQHLFFLHNRGSRLPMVPIVPGIPLPDEVFKIDQCKISCLIMDPDVLQKVRLARLGHYTTRQQLHPTLERYMKRQSTSMPYAGNTNNGR